MFDTALKEGVDQMPTVFWYKIPSLSDGIESMQPEKFHPPDLVPSMGSLLFALFMEARPDAFSGDGKAQVKATTQRPFTPVLVVT